MCVCSNISSNVEQVMQWVLIKSGSYFPSTIISSIFSFPFSPRPVCEQSPHLVKLLWNYHIFSNLECILTVCLCMTTLTEVFPCFFLSCKANARLKPAKTGHGPHSSQLLCCSMYFLCCSMYFCFLCIVPCRSLYCLCVYVYCSTATACLPNCS